MVKEHIYLAIGWILFCVLHSFLASLRFKGVMERLLKKNFQYYRTFYTFFALLSFIIVLLQQIAITSPYIFIPTFFIRVIGGLIAFTGIIGMCMSLAKYIFNIYGFTRLFGKTEVPVLIRGGIHGIVRHPLYLGTFLFLWGGWLIYPWTSLLISNIIITLYTLIGMRLEENKLELQFGESYTDYKKNTPMIIPKVSRIKKGFSE